MMSPADRLKKHYAVAADHFGPPPNSFASYWYESAYITWSAFCLQWVAVAWLMLIGVDQTGHERVEEAA